MVKTHELITAARTWIGVPFMHQGRSRGGLDCVGLLIVALRQVGLVEPGFERTDYGRLPHRNELQEKLSGYCARLEAPTPGCFLAMRWGRQTSHVALYTGDTIIHAYEKRGRVVEHGYRGAWLRLTDSAWMFPGVEP